MKRLETITECETPSMEASFSSATTSSSSSSSFEKPSPTTSKNNDRKRVRISEHQNKIVQEETIALSEEEKNESWWSASEFAATKDFAKRQCRNHRKARRYSDCLTDAYETACHLAQLDENPQQSSNLEYVNNVVEKKPPDQGLVRWLKDKGPRGLEGYSSRLHALRRQRHLQDTKHAVFLEQARQNISNQRDEELLARQAEMASRRARTFASLLGHADAWAARTASANDSDDNEDTICEIPQLQNFDFSMANVQNNTQTACLQVNQGTLCSIEPQISNHQIAQDPANMPGSLRNIFDEVEIVEVDRKFHGTGSHEQMNEYF